jgi:hypothetical protein
MSSLTPRDRWLACSLPALVTFLIAGLFIIRPANRDLANLRKRVQNQGPLSARLELVEAAKVEEVTLRNSIEGLRKAIDEDGHKFDRNWSMQQISRLCAQHGIGLTATSAEPSTRLSASLREAAKSFARDPSPPQVWRFELVGTYPAVVALLDDLQKTKPMIVPIGLSMVTNKNERKPATWNLSIWL